LFFLLQDNDVANWKAECLFQILFHPDNMILPSEFPEELKNMCKTLGLPPKPDSQEHEEA
jgi:hypothetical protein